MPDPQALQLTLLPFDAMIAPSSNARGVVGCASG